MNQLRILSLLQDKQFELYHLKQENEKIHYNENHHSIDMILITAERVLESEIELLKKILQDD